MNKRVKNALLRAGWLAMISIFFKNKSIVILILWMFAWAGFVDIINWLLSLKKKKPDNQSGSKTDPRLNKPRKTVAVLFNRGGSNLLFFLNPLLQRNGEADVLRWPDTTPGT